MDETLIKKLQALLRVRTDRGASQNEMEIALAAAQRMAIKHKIDLATICDESTEDESLGGEIIRKIFKTTFESETREPACSLYVCAILKKFFSVKLVALKPGVKLAVIGKESDVDFAIYVYAYLRGTFNKLWYVEKDLYEYNDSSRDSFFRGLYDGLQTKLADVQMEMEKEAPEKYALVLVADESKLVAKLKEFYPSLRQEKAKFGKYDHSAYESGKEQGGKVGINKPLSHV